MRRAFFCLLIGTVLLSQSLALFAHAHASPSGDESRQKLPPHVHLHGGHHHHHETAHRHHSEEPSDDPGDPSGHEPPGHDDNTVYLSPGNFFGTSSHPGQLQELTAEFTAYPCSIDREWESREDRLTGLPPRGRPKCALFLQLLSIRC